jgi:ChrR-like protein with cupin domain
VTLVDKNTDGSVTWLIWHSHVMPDDDCSIVSGVPLCRHERAPSQVENAGAELVADAPHLREHSVRAADDHLAAMRSASGLQHARARAAGSRCRPAITGDYGYEPNGVIHDMTNFPEDSILYFTNFGPIRYIDDDDNTVGFLDWQGVRLLPEDPPLIRTLFPAKLDRTAYLPAASRAALTQTIG